MIRHRSHPSFFPWTSTVAALRRAARTKPWALIALTILIVTAASIPAFAASSPVVAEARFGIHPDKTRFVLEISEPVDFQVSVSVDPYRVQIDFAGLAWPSVTDGGLKNGGLGKGVVRRYYRQPANVGTSRLVLELTGPARVREAFLIPSRDGHLPRFVLDLEPTSHAVALQERSRVVSGGHSQQTKLSASDAVEKPNPVETPSVADPSASTDLSASTERPAPITDTSQVILDAASSRSSLIMVPAAPSMTNAATNAAENVGSRAKPAPGPHYSASNNTLAPAPVSVSVMSSSPMPSSIAASMATAAAVTVPVTRLPQPIPHPPLQNVKRMVVVDAGHGGEDPGAISANGGYEKDITLAVSREMRRLLERTGRYRVVLTRDSDVFIRLRDRVSRAREVNADLFISLHADSIANPNMHGLSIYSLSDKASDREAEMMAQRENRADAIGGIDLSTESDEVATILIDLAQRDTMNHSRRFASLAIRELGRSFKLIPRPHRSAGFAVLTAPDVPSVLIEMGYLSNSQDLAILTQPVQRENLATTIVHSVDQYFIWLTGRHRT
ncbi:N-acetylmuramoyl-L-alanine amidase [Azospirillaceae bacterium]